MSAADKIAEARALIEPLTGYSPGPWEVVTDLPAIAIAAGNHRVVQTPNQNNYRHFGRSEPWLGIGTFSNAALIAAAPALRDTVAALTDLADAQAQEIARLKAALEPFAQFAKAGGFNCLPDNVAMTNGSSLAWRQVTAGDFKRARATLGDAP